MHHATARSASRFRPSPRRLALHVARGRDPAIVAELEQADRTTIDAILERPAFLRLVEHYRKLGGLPLEERRRRLLHLALDELHILAEEHDRLAIFFIANMNKKGRCPAEVLARGVFDREARVLAGRPPPSPPSQPAPPRQSAAASNPRLPSSAPLRQMLAGLELSLTAAEARLEAGKAAACATPSGQASEPAKSAATIAEPPAPSETSRSGRPEARPDPGEPTSGQTDTASPRPSPSEVKRLAEIAATYAKRHTFLDILKRLADGAQAHTTPTPNPSTQHKKPQGP